MVLLALPLAYADAAPVPTEVAAPVWPSPGAPLNPPPQRPAFGPRKTVMLSAGHGTGSNIGNIGVHGQIEEETALEVVLDLTERLRAIDRFDVVLARKEGERPSYQRRVDRADALGVDVLVELHTDVRGDLYVWAYDANRPIYRADDQPGFSVLYRDKGGLAEQRASLARTVATSMALAGFPPYDGENYTGLFDLDPTPGAFQDRRYLFMLREPTMPSVIVELHNAVDYEESLRWREEGTKDAFAWAMADALTRYLYPDPDDPTGRPEGGEL